jgi:hypothetical protein
VSEERCAVCVVQGGLDVDTEAAAAGASRVVGRRVEVGERLSEEPCLPTKHLASIESEFGRPCPRVELLPENREAAELVWLAVLEHLRPLFGPAFEALSDDLEPEERRRLVMRVSAVLKSDVVMRKLYPDPEETR